MGIFVFFFEIIGTVAFAVSGAIVAIQKNMDVFGISILGLTTATGGGVIRDLLIGNYPPFAFKDPVYALTAIGVSIICFLIAAKGPPLTDKNKARYNRLILIADSAGLGLFAVIGVKIAMESQERSNLFMTVFIGTVTAVGGGVLRDLMAGGVPFILMKHIYACAALAGSLVCALGWELFGNAAAMTAGAGVVFAIRLLSAHYKWNLPKAKPNEST